MFNKSCAASNFKGNIFNVLPLQINHKNSNQKNVQLKFYTELKYFYRIQAKQTYFQAKKKREWGGQQLHIFTKGKTEEENKIRKRRIKMQEGLLRK